MRATRGWHGLTCGPILSVGGARAERELGGEAKQAERSVGERAADDAHGLASAGGGRPAGPRREGEGTGPRKREGQLGRLGRARKGKEKGWADLLGWFQGLGWLDWVSPFLFLFPLFYFN